MSDAIPSYGFTAARRGYAPEQVDRALIALTSQRDEAWQRLSWLGAQIRELEAVLAATRKAAAEAPEPDYTTLSEQAADLMAIADNEARQVRDKAERFAEDTRDETYQAGQELQAEAAAYATATRAEADLAARRIDERTRAEAEKLRGEADADSRAIRDGATAEAAKIRVAAAEAGERAETKLAELRRDADERFAAEEAAAAAEDAKISQAAERRLKEAEQHRESVLSLIKQIDTDAQAKADRLIEQARREADKIEAASAAERAAFDKRLETVQTHLDHIKGTLASLTGKAVGMIEPAGPGTAVTQVTAAAPAVQETQVTEVIPTVQATDPEADTGEVPLPPAPAAPPTLPTASSDAPTTVLRLPADLRDAPAPPPPGGTPPVDPRTALRAAGAAQPPLPPRPATPPPTAQGSGAAPVAGPAPEDETRIIPKIVIIDDGTEIDSLPNTVGRRRT
ncbi:hypothetical protein OG500_22815 [Kitasatospora sp. NBC_01250]|uniref:hypothetical protein n=1 Tax=Kitasatospora sp. NBC_01250 TaxID=2903571 RepID=UPI002E372A6F|nr:hypothetical protein [Kitasatospora sp. NBC_01250]